MSYIWGTGSTLRNTALKCKVPHMCCTKRESLTRPNIEGTSADVNNGIQL
jgi:hypothetical protein